MGTAKDSERTRNKLIDAAGELFAEKGFKGVSVRAIAQKAEVPFSGINYHFRSKEELYKTTVETACAYDLLSKDDQEAFLQMEPVAALSLLISELENSYRQMDNGSWQNKLIAREAHNPSEVFTEISKNYYKPQADFTAGLIGRVVNKPIDDINVRLATITLTSLFDTIFGYKPYVESMAPGITDYFSSSGKFSTWVYDLVVQTASK